MPDSGLEPRRSKPPIIVVTWIICIGQIVALPIGVSHRMGLFDAVRRGEIPALNYAGSWLILVVWTVLVIATLYSSLRRRPWGRWMVLLLASVLAVIALHGALDTSYFAPAGRSADTQQGARLGAWLALATTLPYAIFAAIGRNVRRYFRHP